MHSEPLSASARGRWPEIMRALAPHPAMLEAIARSEKYPGQKGRWLTSCPVHGGRSGRAFHVYPDFAQTGGCVCNTCFSGHGFDALMWLNGWDPQHTGRELRAFLEEGAILTPRRPLIVAPARPASVERDEEDRQKSQAELQAWWDEAVALDHPAAEPVRRYFLSRGLGAVPALASLRCHPALPFTEKRPERYPTLLAVYRDRLERLVGLHLTFLTADGAKAAVPVAKMSKKARGETLTGAAVKLTDAGPMLGIAEGLETTLSVFLATAMPVWAAMSAPLLRSVVVPTFVQRTVIWADYDELTRLPNGTFVEPGRDAAEALAQRLACEYRSAQILYPRLPLHGRRRRAVDWNDVWVQHGAAGFPTLNRFALSLPSAAMLARRLRGDRE